MQIYFETGRKDKMKGDGQKIIKILGNQFKKSSYLYPADETPPGSHTEPHCTL